MATANDVLAVARSQIGYTESPANSNNTKYGAAYGLNYNPWCMMFVWWCFVQAGAADLFYGGGKTASCPTFERWARQQGSRWITRGFAPGDIVLYDFDGGTADHVGIVEVAQANGVDAIEGNTSLNRSQDNGGAVLRRYRSNSLIIGAYRPAYSGASATPSPTTGNSAQTGGFDLASLKMLSKGDAGSEVWAMQLLLKGYGYSLGWYGADGDFGSATEKAVVKYQSANGLDADGICGPKTWAKLLGV